MMKLQAAGGAELRRGVFFGGSPLYWDRVSHWTQRLPILTHSPSLLATGALCLCAEHRITGTHVPAAFCVSAKIRTRPSARSTFSNEPSSYPKPSASSCKFLPFILLSLVHFPSVYHPSTHSCPCSFYKFAPASMFYILMYVLYSH